MKRIFLGLIILLGIMMAFAQPAMAIDQPSSEVFYGIFLDEVSTNEDNLVSLLIDGKVKEFVVGDEMGSGVDQGDLVKFQINADGKFVNGHLLLSVGYIQDLIDEDIASSYEIDHFDIADKSIRFKEVGFRDDFQVIEKISILEDNVTIYDCTGDTPKVGSKADLTKGAYVQIADYNAEDDTFSIVVICSKNNRDYIPPTITVNPGSGTLIPGTAITITATDPSGINFIKYAWNDNSETWVYASTVTTYVPYAEESPYLYVDSADGAANETGWIMFEDFSVAK